MFFNCDRQIIIISVLIKLCFGFDQAHKLEFNFWFQYETQQNFYNIFLTFCYQCVTAYTKHQPPNC